MHIVVKNEYDEDARRFMTIDVRSFATKEEVDAFIESELSESELDDTYEIERESGYARIVDTETLSTVCEWQVWTQV